MADIGMDFGFGDPALSPSDNFTSILTNAMLVGCISVFVLNVATSLPFGGVMFVSGFISVTTIVGMILRQSQKEELYHRRLDAVRHMQLAAHRRKREMAQALRS